MSIVHYLSYLIMWFRDSFRCFPIGVVFESLLRTIMLNGDVWSPSTVQKDDANRDTMPLNTGASESHPLEVACEIGLEPGECLRRLQGGWSVRLPGVGVGMGMGGCLLAMHMRMPPGRRQQRAGWGRTIARRQWRRMAVRCSYLAPPGRCRIQAGQCM